MINLTKEELKNYNFPKWPQMRVLGKKITQEQAWEVIRRTDHFFIGYDGNDKDFSKHWGKKLVHPSYTNPRLGYEYTMQWGKIWEMLELEYLYNAWLSCAFIGGPHGWCSPKGYIYFQDNIGKWPKPEEVLEEWSIIAKEFPFLELDAVIMSEKSDGDEKEEPLPILRYHVEKGEVVIFVPEISGLGMVEHWKEEERKNEIGIVVHLFSTSFEHHPLAGQMLESYVTKFADKIKEFEEWKAKKDKSKE